MSKREKLLRRARNDQGSLRFEELCWLTESFGFKRAKKRGKGSHFHQYKREGYMRLLNYQADDSGMAKRYQVRDLLNAIDELELDKE